MKKLIAAAILLTTTSASPQANDVLTYRFEDVKRSVMLRRGSAESKASKGSSAVSGDRVKTGWFAYTLIASEKQKARFEVYGSSEVALTSSTPGVVLTLERGSVHAIFDKLLGSEPRVVQTPGALLAVRGTEFNVHVNAKGETTVDVFAGLVEIDSPLRPEPLFVRPGESSVFSPREPPAVVQTPNERRREGDHRPFGPGDRNAPRDPRGGENGEGQRGGSDPRDPRGGAQPPNGGQRPDRGGPGGAGPGGAGPSGGPPPPPPPRS